VFILAAYGQPGSIPDSLPNLVTSLSDFYLDDPPSYIVKIGRFCKRHCDRLKRLCGDQYDLISESDDDSEIYEGKSSFDTDDLAVRATPSEAMNSSLGQHMLLQHKFANADVLSVQTANDTMSLSIGSNVRSAFCENAA
jgi:hypothetical protein